MEEGEEEEEVLVVGLIFVGVGMANDPPFVPFEVEEDLAEEETEITSRTQTAPRPIKSDGLGRVRSEPVHLEDIPVSKRLKSSEQWWIDNAANYWADLAQEGWKPQWKSTPTQRWEKRPSDLDSERKDAYVREMLDQGVLEPILKQEAVCVLPCFLIPKKFSPKLRFVLDCRHVNQFLEAPYVRIDGAREVKEVWTADLQWGAKLISRPPIGMCGSITFIGSSS